MATLCLTSRPRPRCRQAQLRWHLVRASSGAAGTGVQTVATENALRTPCGLQQRRRVAPQRLEETNMQVRGLSAWCAIRDSNPEPAD